MMGQERKIIDIHAHVLPGVDDGARDFEESCRLLRMAALQGITAVIATPHYSRRRALPEIEETAERLQFEVRKRCPGFNIYPGQEMRYHEGLVEHLREGGAHTMAGSRYVLVEFDETESYPEILRGIRALINGGYIPILAHIERYPCLRRKGCFEELSENGCVFQMNYDSLQVKGISSLGEVGWCRRQVMNGWIRLLGTDMHRLNYRPPNIGEAMRWLERHVEEELLRNMIYRNPLHIINDEGID